MRPCASACALACTALVASWPRSARATDCTAPLSTCINDDVLWPHAGYARFSSIGGAETLGSGQLGFGLVSTYLSRPIVLHLSSPGGPGFDENAIDDQGNGTFLWSYGVTRRLELDVALPLTYGQSGTGLAPATGGSGGINDTAVRDFRFGLTYELVRSRPATTLGAQHGEAGWGLAARFEVSAPSGDRDQFAGERAAVFIPSVSAQARSGPFFAGAELGLRVRPTTELAEARIGTQLFAAGGVGVDALPRDRLAFAFEAWALPTLEAQYASPGSSQSPGPLVPAEWQVSARSAFLPQRDLSIQLGGGGALSDALTTPRLRLVLSLRWAPRDDVRRSHPTSVP